ncbi:MAG: hypothetical protein WCQ99_14295, partial [Pseudomonadota bacterium]
MKKAYTFFGITLVIFWAVMIGALVKKHVFVSKPASLEKQYMPEFIESREEWARIYLKDKKIGYSHAEIK